MAKRQRSWIPRSIKLIPAAVISAILLAIMSLLGLLNLDLGIPSVSTPTAEAPHETSDQAPAAPGSPSDLTSTDVEPADESVVSEPPWELANPTHSIDVLIDGDEYLLALHRPDGETVRERRTLEEIVALAEQMPGDATGVRARISRRFNATARADRALMEALFAAGLTSDEIDHRRTLVDGD